MNPISEKFAWLRPSLAPGLIDSLLYNRNRQTEDIRLFEVGTTFSRTRGERACVGWVLTGARHRHWSTATDAIDFSDAKGVADLVVAALGGRVELEATTELSWLVPGRAARLTTPSGVVGWVGQLVATDAADVIFGGEIDLAALSTSPSATTPRIQPLPTQPSIIRDLSIVVDERLPAADVRGTIRSHAPPTLIDVQEFDRYQGKGVQEGRVSLSVRLTFRAADRTLTDAEVQPAIDHIVQALLREHGATLRGA
jgi:phenylalanyl-tRNA synthetase beta chain